MSININMLHRIDIIKKREEDPTKTFALCNVYLNESEANNCKPPVESYELEITNSVENSLFDNGFTLSDRGWIKEEN